MTDTIWLLVEKERAEQALECLSRAGLRARASDESSQPAPPLPQAPGKRWVELALPQTQGEGAQRLACGEIVLDALSRQVTVGKRPVALTPTEFRLLQVFLENPGCALTRRRLAEGLPTEEAALGRSLDGHIKNLRRKIEPDPDHPRLLQTVYGTGYRLACN